MIKKSIRMTSFTLSMFLLILVLQYLSITQKNMPFGTDIQFEMDIFQMDSNKEKLVNDLNAITEKNHSVLVKVITNTNNYMESKDIIWFGNKEPIPIDISIAGKKIDWIDFKMEGHLIESKEIGNRPLYGIYSVKDNKQMKQDLENWANNNGLQIHWLSPPSLTKMLSTYLLQNGIGNTVITAFMLLLSAIVSWFVVHSKTRAYRLLGGVGLNKLHWEDTLEILKLCISGSCVAWGVMIGIFVAKKGIKQVALILVPSLVATVFLYVVIAIVIWIISHIVSPKAEHIGKREIPLRHFAQLSLIIRIITIVLALMILPTTITSAYIFQQLSNEHALWKTMQQNVRLSFGDIDSLETEETLPKVELFFDEMNNRNNLQMSLVIDKSILLSKEELGPYDHIIITDKAWINSFNIGVNESREGGTLFSVNFSGISEPLRKYLEEQLPLWTKTGEVIPDGMGFYEYEGDKFLALPPNVGWGAETVQSENPLVILVDNAAEVLKTKGFLLYAASSGNVIFSNTEILKEGLEKYELNSAVVSIDSIADVALEQAQKFRKEAVYYIIACILILVTMILLGVLSAQLWCGANIKKIFVLHTFGYDYKYITSPIIKKEIIIVILILIIGSLVSSVIKRNNIILIACVSSCIAILYGIGTAMAYQICMRRNFKMISNRLL